MTPTAPTKDRPWAFISDLHSNLEALEAVFRDIAEQGAGDIFCLGDVVGYGPDPEACVDLVMAKCRLTLKGNHDAALIEGEDRFNRYARDAIRWTRRRLKPGWFKSSRYRERWDWLRNLPLQHKDGELLFVHGSPRDPLNEYIYPGDILFNAEGKLAEIFRAVPHALFVGHTHHPMVLSSRLGSFTPAEGRDRIALGSDRYIVNVGSVGQPRDGDPRACYVLFDGEEVRYRRIPYDIDAVARKIDRIPELDAVLGQRLHEGL